MIDNELKSKLKAVEVAEASVIKRLEELYPKGKDLNVIIRTGQKYPSGATVIGHDGGRWGYVRVRLHTGKQSVKTVPADCIL